ncbi:MAG: hypothetical protein ACOX5Q_03850 [Bacillota bacterium]
MCVAQKLDDLNMLHMASTTLTHGIRREEGTGWRGFPPSKFVYAYFAFNSTYSVDWHETLKQGVVVEWGPVREMEKIKSYVTFTGGVEEEGAATWFLTKLTLYTRQWANLDLNDAERELGFIVDDERSGPYRNAFRGAFRAICAEEKPKPFVDLLCDLLRFIYQVRNNIFHGTKTFSDMADERQQRRLSIYTAILCATQDVFFESARRHFRWYPRDAQPPRNRFRGPLRPQLTLKQLFGIQVPNGPLFYPCCGNDTFEPIQLFIDTVSDFYFIDSNLIPSLPRADRAMTSTDVRRHGGRVAHPFVRQVHIEQKPGYNRYTWMVGPEPASTVQIHCKMEDGEAAFSQIPRLSVFYYRGDSPGEGGSGVWWLGEELFNMILDKLVDGGLVVTDGSNWDPAFPDAPWSAMWQEHCGWKDSRDLRLRKSKFAYRDRQFSRLCQCGSRYGPVYVWRVTR